MEISIYLNFDESPHNINREPVTNIPSLRLREISNGRGRGEIENHAMPLDC